MVEIKEVNTGSALWNCLLVWKSALTESDC